MKANIYRRNLRLNQQFDKRSLFFTSGIFGQKILTNYLKIIGYSPYLELRSWIRNMAQGVDEETCSTFPLKYFCPFKEKSARYFAASLTESPAFTEGNASPNISVCTEPKAMLLTEIFFSLSSTAKHSLRFTSAAFVAE